MANFAALMVSGALAQIMSVMFFTAPSSSAAGTTRFTRPMS